GLGAGFTFRQDMYGGGFTTSVPVVSLNSRAHAFVDANAVVHAAGSVLIQARDDTDTDVFAGAAGLGRGTGVGAAAGLVLIDKDTQAFIGQGATVDADASTTSNVAVFSGDVGTTIFQEIRKGVAVQASSSELTFGLITSGGGSLERGISGAVLATV